VIDRILSTKLLGMAKEHALKAALAQGKKLVGLDPISRMIRETCKAEGDNHLDKALRVWLDIPDFQTFLKMESAGLTDQMVVESFAAVLRFTSYPSADTATARRVLTTFFGKWRFEKLHGEDAIATVDALAAMRDKNMVDVVREEAKALRQQIAQLESATRTVLSRAEAIADAELVASREGFLTAARLTPVALVSEREGAPEHIPPLVERVARRPETVTSLREQVSAATWTAVVGEPESGKTQLGVLLARQWSSVHWFSAASFASVDTLERRLRSMSAVADGALFVFDDLPTLDDRDGRSGLLRDLARTGSGHVHILSLSSARAPRQVRDVLGDRFITGEIPPFNDSEARDLFFLYGAPPDLHEDTVAFLNAHAEGNPTLLTALAKYLNAHGWSIDGNDIKLLLAGAHLKEIGPELMVRLRNDVQDPATRELFSRTRVARRNVSLDDIRALAEVDPAIDHVVERLLDLDGLWLRREAGDRYTPTPLAMALPGGDLKLATERGCHIVLAERITAQGRMDSDALMDAVAHFMAAEEFNRAGSLFAYALVRIVQDEAWHQRLLPAMYTAKPLPPKMALHLRLSIRTQQLKIARKQGRRDARLLGDALRLVHQASPDDAVFVARFAVEVAFEDDGDHETWSAAMDALSKLTELRPTGADLSFMGETFQKETWAVLFYMVGRSVRTVADVDRWTGAAERLPETRRREILASAFDRQSLVNAAWLRYGKTPRAPWNEVLAVHRRWREWAERTGDSLLSAYAVRAEVIVRAEYLGESDEAIAFATEMLAREDGRHEQFLLNETIATQLRRLRRYEEAERRYGAAFTYFDSATQVEQVFALHNAASVTARHDLGAAAILLERARTIVRDSTNEFEPVRLAMVSADLGLAYWYGGRFAEAFIEWDSIASTLLDETMIKEDQRRGLTALLMMVLKQIADVLGRAKDLTDDERAVVGTFDRDLNAVAPHWKPAQAVMLATELTSIAASVGREDKAYQWIDRAVTAAREINEPTVTAFVAMKALPWTLMRNDFTGASGFIAEVRDRTDHVESPGDSEIAQYVLLTSFQLCSLLLTESERAREGMATTGAALRALQDEPDAVVLADLLAAAADGDTDLLERLWDRTNPGTAVGGVAYLLRSFSRGQSTMARASDHLTIAPYVASRFKWWGVAYARIVVPFFEQFWQREASVNAFRFRAPENLRRELAATHARPPEQRLQGILEAVSDALEMQLPPQFREWFRGGA
jgi:hypothetical protein